MTVEELNTFCNRTHLDWSIYSDKKEVTAQINSTGKIVYQFSLDKMSKEELEDWYLRNWIKIKTI